MRYLSVHQLLQLKLYGAADDTFQREFGMTHGLAFDSSLAGINGVETD